MFSMGGLHADRGLLAEQFGDINFIVTDWIDHLVVRICNKLIIHPVC